MARPCVAGATGGANQSSLLYYGARFRVEGLGFRFRVEGVGRRAWGYFAPSMSGSISGLRQAFYTSCQTRYLVRGGVIEREIPKATLNRKPEAYAPKWLRGTPRSAELVEVCSLQI